MHRFGKKSSKFLARSYQAMKVELGAPASAWKPIRIRRCSQRTFDLRRQVHESNLKSMINSISCLEVFFSAATNETKPRFFGIIGSKPISVKPKPKPEHRGLEDEKLLKRSDDFWSRWRWSVGWCCCFVIKASRVWFQQSAQHWKYQMTYSHWICQTVSNRGSRY